MSLPAHCLALIERFHQLGVFAPHEFTEINLNSADAAVPGPLTEVEIAMAAMTLKRMVAEHVDGPASIVCGLNEGNAFVTALQSLGEKFDRLSFTTVDEAGTRKIQVAEQNFRRTFIGDEAVLVVGALGSGKDELLAFQRMRDWLEYADANKVFVLVDTEVGGRNLLEALHFKVFIAMTKTEIRAHLTRRGKI